MIVIYERFSDEVFSRLNNIRIQSSIRLVCFIFLCIDFSAQSPPALPPVVTARHVNDDYSRRFRKAYFEFTIFSRRQLIWLRKRELQSEKTVSDMLFAHPPWAVVPATHSPASVNFFRPPAFFGLASSERAFFSRATRHVDVFHIQTRHGEPCKIILRYTPISR